MKITTILTTTMSTTDTSTTSTTTTQTTTTSTTTTIITTTTTTTTTTQHWLSLTTTPVDLESIEKRCKPSRLKYYKKEWIGDGTCNPYLNNKRCAYDGGDCCLETIDDTLCHDHSAGCNCHLTGVRKPSFQEVFNTTCTQWPFMKDITNSKCQDEFNTKECNYDGHACCWPQIDDSECKRCICHLDNTRHPPYTAPNKIIPYQSEIQGIKTEYIETCAKLIEMKNFPFTFQDTVCNQEANNRFCNYDQGACCKVDYIDWTAAITYCEFDNCACRFDSYTPKEAHEMILSQKPTYEPDSENCNIWLLGNGKCEEDHNNEECFYDLGDCLVFDNAPKQCNVSVERLGDGICDPEANIPACNFDKKDCCLQFIHGPECPEPQSGFVSDQMRPCTCHEDGLDHLLASSKTTILLKYFAVSQASLLLFLIILGFADPSCNLDTIGDRICDDENNKKGCFFDWSDCCLEWQIDDSRCTDCICHKYNLKYPNAESTEEEREMFKKRIVDTDKLVVDYLNPKPFQIDLNTDMFNFYLPGDTICDGSQNNAFFNYDGLDCCLVKLSPGSFCDDELGVSLSKKNCYL